MFHICSGRTEESHLLVYSRLQNGEGKGKWLHLHTIIGVCRIQIILQLSSYNYLQKREGKGKNTVKRKEKDHLIFSNRKVGKRE